MSTQQQMIGMRFGRLIALAEAGRKRRDRCYLCRCDCGTERVVVGYALKNGNTRSCGCLRDETTAKRSFVHGQSRRQQRTREYNAWSHMIARVNATQGRCYKYYASRGIAVCERWRSFENFFADMGTCPIGLTLDRENNDGNYEPSNCRWATWSQQVGNRRFLGRET